MPGHECFHSYTCSETPSRLPVICSTGEDSHTCAPLAAGCAGPGASCPSSTGRVSWVQRCSRARGHGGRGLGQTAVTRDAVTTESRNTARRRREASCFPQRCDCAAVLQQDLPLHRGSMTGCDGDTDGGSRPPCCGLSVGSAWADFRARTQEHPRACDPRGAVTVTAAPGLSWLVPY